MESTHLKRSREPIYWGLFGFGGMVIAFAMPAILICLIIAGLTDGHQGFHFLETISHWWGAGALFIILFGASFHCFHRIYYTLRDLKLPAGRITHVILYGTASCISIASAVLLVIYYIRQF